jgi:hypothetical protein
VRQPRAQGRDGLGGRARRHDLQHGADPGAGRIAIAPFLEHVAIWAAADHDIRDSARRFLGDEELELPGAGRREGRQHAALRERVADVVGRSMLGERVRGRAHLMHPRDVLDVALVAGAHEHGRRAGALLRPQPQRGFHHRDRREPETRVVLGVDLRVQKRVLDPLARRVLHHRLDQRRRVPFSAEPRRREHRADADAGDLRARKRERQPVALRAREQLAALHPRDAVEVARAPRRHHLRLVEALVIAAREPVAPDLMGLVVYLLQDGAGRFGNNWHEGQV